MTKKKPSKAVKLTYKTLVKYFDALGWEVRHHGCRHYILYNSHGKKTNILFWLHEDMKDGELRFVSDRDAFGKGGADYVNHGLMCFKMKDLLIESLDEDCVCIRLKTNKNAFFLFFSKDK